MAGAGYKLFNTGDVLTAAQVNTYLNEQTVMVFASSTARTTALSSVLAEGMVSYLQDTNAVEVYNGSAWVGVSGAGDVTEVQAGTGISVASGTGPIPVVTNTMATEITASGDIIVGTGSGTFDNLPIGTTGQVLTADTTVSPYKVKWASAASSGGMTLINTGGTSLTGSSVTISSIPTTYIKLYCIVRNMTVSTDNGNFRIRLNGDSTANRYRNLYSWGAADDQAFNEDYLVGQRGSDNTADDNLAFFEINDYANTSTWKVVNVQSVSQNATTPANINQLQCFGYYNQLSAITSIEIYASSGTFNSGVAYLYGVK